jgi:hypothetical protein
MAELTLSPDRIVELYGHDRGEAVIRFTARAPDLVFELIQRHGIACEARRSGWIEGTPYASGMRSMEKRVASWRGHGEPVELLGRDAIRELPVRRLTPVGSSIAVAERSIRFPTIADWRPPRSALALSSMAMWRRADWRRKAAAGGSRRGADRCVRAA